MFELGMKDKIFGVELLKPLTINKRPVELPELSKDERVVAGFDQGLGERMIVCNTVEDMQKLYDSHGRGMALRLNWYVGPDPGMITIPAGNMPSDEGQKLVAITPGFSLAPGTATALTNTKDSRAYFIFTGDLNQMGIIEDALRDAGFPVVKSNVYPGFPKNDEANFVKALRYVFEHRTEGWWNQQNALIEHGICTNDEFEAALSEQVSNDHADYQRGKS